MTVLTLLNGAAIVALVALSFQIWGWSTETDKPAIRLIYRFVAAVCGTMIVAIAYFVPYALVAAALAGAAIGIVLTARGNWARSCGRRRSVDVRGLRPPLTQLRPARDKSRKSTAQRQFALLRALPRGFRSPTN
jgi:hypothetical protein